MTPHARAAVRDGRSVHSRIAPVGERESIGGLLARNVARWGAQPMYAERRGGAFEPVTWSEFAHTVAAFGEFLRNAGVGAGTRVTMLSPNRGEMLVAEFATMSLGAVYAPIFEIGRASCRERV